MDCNNRVLEISNLLFGYTKNSNIINISNFILNKGERLLITGKSGIGKTTFLQLISGLLTPLSGNIKLLDNQITQLCIHQKDLLRCIHIGYIFQNLNLIPYLTIEENILLPFKINTTLKNTQEHHYKNFLDLTTYLDIQHILSKKPFEISNGQAQRSVIARAILKKPSLLLMDEATSALDNENKHNILILLDEICKKEAITIIATNHDESISYFFNKIIDFKNLNN